MNLVDRLRRYGDSEPRQRGGRLLCSEAADEIESLRAVLAEIATTARDTDPEILNVGWIYQRAVNGILGLPGTKGATSEVVDRVLALHQGKT